MTGKKKEAETKIEIAEDVIATLVSQAISQIAGVHSLHGRTRDILSRKPSRGAIKIDFVNPEEITIDLRLVMEYGFSIPEVAKEVQAAVAREVQAATKLRVKKVNIFAEDIFIPTT